MSRGAQNVGPWGSLGGEASGSGAAPASLAYLNPSTILRAPSNAVNHCFCPAPRGSALCGWSACSCRAAAKAPHALQPRLQTASAAAALHRLGPALLPSAPHGKGARLGGSRGWSRGVRQYLCVVSCQQRCPATSSSIHRCGGIDSHHQCAFFRTPQGPLLTLRPRGVLHQICSQA